MPHQPSAPPARRPQTEFATVLAAIDANEDGDHVHITEMVAKLRNAFPDGFEEAMSNGFKARVTIRKRKRDNKGRVTTKGAKTIVVHAGRYVEKVCESLSQPREWYPKHYGRFQVVSFGARWLTRELKDEFDQYGDISTDKLREALQAQGYRPDLILDGMRKFDDPEGRECRDHTGYHKQIMKGIALSHEFVDFVNENKRRILEPARLSACYAATRYETTKRIFIWCRSGRHRSVALTVLMKACLEQDGFKVDVINLRKSWRPLCGGPGRCKECKTAPWVNDPCRVAQVV